MVKKATRSTEQYEKTPIAGAELSVYHIATVGINTDKKLNYIYTDDFATIGIAIDDPDLAAKLDAYLSENEEDFYKRLEAQVRVLIEMSDKMWGFCYTQLTDVEQEQNGIYYYNRGVKYDMERVRKIFQMELPNK